MFDELEEEKGNALVVDWQNDEHSFGKDVVSLERYNLRNVNISNKVQLSLRASTRLPDDQCTVMCSRKD